MEFLSDEHKKRFWAVKNEDKDYTPSDTERTALFFIIAGSEELFLHRHEIYNFKERGINIIVNYNGSIELPAAA